MSLLNNKKSDCDGLVRDCVGKIGDCPIVTKVEDCYNFSRNEMAQKIKNYDDVCHTDQIEMDNYKQTLINILDDVIKVLVKYHTELQK